ncbi:MAG: hypothetical protein LBS99_05490, partial [Clostridiales bacterium]|nr:hypothetical protein [Clostridiales bacterium]
MKKLKNWVIIALSLVVGLALTLTVTACQNDDPDPVYVTAITVTGADVTGGGTAANPYKVTIVVGS